LASLNIVSGPMVPFTCRRIRVVTEKHETSGCRRYGPPVQGRGPVFPITGETARDR
jgi:hypothetical protein